MTNKLISYIQQTGLLDRQIKVWYWPTIILAIVMLIFSHYWWYTNRPTSFVLGSHTDLTPSEIIRLTNQARKEAGLSELRTDPRLSRAAQAKAEHMRETGVFEHYYQTDTAENVDPWQFITESGYSYSYAGENLGRDYFTSQSLLDAWIESPTHRANLLNPNYQDIGVAVLEGEYLEREESVLVVQLFAAPIEVLVEESDSELTQLSSSLLVNQDSLGRDLLSQYPIWLLISTTGLLWLICVTFLLEYLSHQDKSEKKLSSDLWKH